MSAGVVRVGMTVRKPATASTPAIGALLRHLHATGFVGAPRFHGLDGRGRPVLDYVDGPLAENLASMSLHDLARGAPHPGPARCHHDLAPWNLVCSDAGRVFIDWDGAGAGSRLWDLGYPAHGFVPLHAGGTPATDGPRLRALVDGSGLSAAERKRLPALI